MHEREKERERERERELKLKLKLSLFIAHNTTAARGRAQPQGNMRSRQYRQVIVVSSMSSCG